MKILVPFLTALLFISCGQQPETAEQTENTEETKATTEEAKTGWFGEEFEIAEAVAPSDVPGLMEQGANELTVKGTIEECCQKKGCWMTVAMDNGESMRVSFKDYGFFVPLDAAGSTMTMQGTASYDTLDVDYLRHLAEDAGQPEEEIQAINEPELALVFEATGVYIEE